MRYSSTEHNYGTIILVISCGWGWLWLVTQQQVETSCVTWNSGYQWYDIRHHTVHTTYIIHWPKYRRIYSIMCTGTSTSTSDGLPYSSKEELQNWRHYYVESIRCVRVSPVRLLSLLCSKMEESNCKWQYSRKVQDYLEWIFQIPHPPRRPNYLQSICMDSQYCTNYLTSTNMTPITTLHGRGQHHSAITTSTRH